MALCYKDKVYCKSDCANTFCRHFAYKGLQNEADKFGLPVCYVDFSPVCVDYIKKE